MNKEINLIKNIFISNFRRLSSPYKITFALTYRCNLKCKICRIWERPPKKEIGIEEIENIFKGLNNLSWIDITGGEVTLREGLFDIINVIIKNSKKILIFHISTNGQLSERTLLLVKKILKFNLIPIVNISIDGPRSVNDQLRGVGGAYSNSLETFKKLKKLSKGYYYLSCTISSYNINYIDELIIDLKREIPNFSFSDLHFNVFQKSPHYYNNQDINGLSGLGLDNLRKYLSICKRGNPVKFFLEKEYIKELSNYLNGNSSHLRCQALNASCFINPYGTIFPCSIYNECVGELKDYALNLNKLWNSQEAFAVRKKIEKGNCNGCWSPCEAYPAILGSVIGNLFIRLVRRTT